MGCSTKIHKSWRDSQRYTVHIWNMYGCFYWTLSLFSIPTAWGAPECVHQRHPAIHPTRLLLLLSSLISDSRFFSPFVFLPFRLPFSAAAPSPTHSDIIVHIPTLLPWHTLQHSAYHAVISTQTHISFHSNNPTPCPRLLFFSSLLPFHIYRSLWCTFALLRRQASQRLFTWQWL